MWDASSEHSNESFAKVHAYFFAEPNCSLTVDWNTDDSGQLDSGFSLYQVQVLGTESEDHVFDTAVQFSPIFQMGLK